mmetsp:Transcript_45505/g.131801  ORF Transcript_45505/g.131801 Transcript_45505/m.131801 type:complete len:239 (+) Transcript_45505:319-1035(+)
MGSLKPGLEGRGSLPERAPVGALLAAQRCREAAAEEAEEQQPRSRRSVQPHSRSGSAAEGDFSIVAGADRCARTAMVDHVEPRTLVDVLDSRYGSIRAHADEAPGAIPGPLAAYLDCQQVVGGAEGRHHDQGLRCPAILGSAGVRHRGAGLDVPTWWIISQVDCDESAIGLAVQCNQAITIGINHCEALAVFDANSGGLLGASINLVFLHAKEAAVSDTEQGDVVPNRQCARQLPSRC